MKKRLLNNALLRNPVPRKHSDSYDFPWYKARVLFKVSNSQVVSSARSEHFQCSGLRGQHTACPHCLRRTARSGICSEGGSEGSSAPGMACGMYIMAPCLARSSSSWARPTLGGQAPRIRTGPELQPRESGARKCHLWRILDSVDERVALQVRVWLCKLPPRLVAARCFCLQRISDLLLLSSLSPLSLSPMLAFAPLPLPLDASNLTTDCCCCAAIYIYIYIYIYIHTYIHTYMYITYCK